MKSIDFIQDFFNVKFKLRKYSDSWIMVLIRQFLNIITLGNINLNQFAIVLPDGTIFSEKGICHDSTLIHEAIHLNQIKNTGLTKYLFRYFLFPFPVFWTGRRWYEAEAYAFSAYHELLHYIPDRVINEGEFSVLCDEARHITSRIANNHFCKLQYFYMSANTKIVADYMYEIVRGFLKDLKNPECQNSDYSCFWKIYRNLYFKQ